MAGHDLVVVGGGVSGLALAAFAAGDGRRVLVLEASAEMGGALATVRAPDGYWFELGAHTCYRSYVQTAALLEACGLRARILPRTKTRLRFLDGDRLLPGSNLGALLGRLSWGELLRSFPRGIRAAKAGQTVYGYYAGLVGRGNYARVLGPMLSAVPSQPADAFPADLLFKSRATRRKDLPRSFTLEGGLRTIADALAGRPGVEVRKGAAAVAVEPAAPGRPGAVRLGDGVRLEAPLVAVATPPAEAARLLKGALPELATQAARVAEAVVESLGVSVPPEAVSLPPSTFLIPHDDDFHSVVSRDPVPGPRRAFTFHFRPGLRRDAKLARAARLLGVAPERFVDVAERTTRLPSPVLGHAEVVAEVDRLLAGKPVALTGNWFGGLSIEDCVSRSASEWRRIAALSR